MANIQINNSAPAFSSSPALDRFSTSLLDSPLFAVAQDSLINFKVVGHSEGNVFITLCLPEALLRGFVRMLESLGDLFRFMNLKGRQVKSQARVFDLDTIKQRNDYKNDLSKATVHIFDRLKKTGLADRQAISETNKEMKALGKITCYYQVELMLREHGKLSKKKAKT